MGSGAGGRGGFRGVRGTSTIRSFSLCRDPIRGRRWRPQYDHGEPSRDLPRSFRGTDMTLSRRAFIRSAATIGAAWAWGGCAVTSRLAWRERRELYPEGVASGDPDDHSVILWTRRPFDHGDLRDQGDQGAQ